MFVIKNIMLKTVKQRETRSQCLTELTIIYMGSDTASRKSMARKALYFARRRTDRSLSTLPTSATGNVWNALSDHRSSLHATEGAVVAQLQFYTDIVDLVASLSRRSSSFEGRSHNSVLQLIDAYGSLIDCVGYLGAERAACTALLPSTDAVCDPVGNREMFLYARAAFAAEICFRSLGRGVTPAAKTKMLTAVRLYGDDSDGLAACRRRLLPDFSAVKRVQSSSACGRSRRGEQLRRLHLSLNGSTSDAADSILGQLERDIITNWISERRAASWRLVVTVAALSTSVVYMVIGLACQCKTLLRRCRSEMAVFPSQRDYAPANHRFANDLEGHPVCIAGSLTKSTSV